MARLDHLLDILGDSILPLLSVHDLVSLGRCSRPLHAALLQDGSNEAERVWKNRINQDLRFPIESTARTEGWRRLYRKIRKAHVYLWGEARNARLALTRDDPRVNLLSRNGGLAVPARLPSLPAPIIDLVAGGWSFHALSVSGQVLHWGQLDGSAFAPYRPASSPVPPLAHPGTMASTPMKLTADIPPIQRLLAGRRHVLALDEHEKVWTWANWAEIGRLRVPWLDPKSWRIVDLTAGWDVSAVLTEFTKKENNTSAVLTEFTKKENNTYRGRQAVRVWWQRFLAPSLRTVDTLGAPGPDRVSGSNGCFHFTPSQVLTLPDLPSVEADDGDAHQKIVKLAAGEEFLIALTESGRIYKMDLSFPPVAHQPGQLPEEEPATDDGTLPPRRFADFEALFESGRRNWEYMEHFSANLDTRDKIHHVSASFRTFFAIGKGRVLQGNREMTGAAEPILMPSLQNKGVIRVECGDYHYGALTSSGELLTFGAYSKGALGHGIDNSRLFNSAATASQDVDVVAEPYHHRPDGRLDFPRKVEFYDPLDTKERRGEEEFVFNTAFAGWASSALTVSLGETDDDDDDESQAQAEKENESDSGNAPSHEDDDQGGASRDSGGTTGLERGAGEAQMSEETDSQLDAGHRVANTRLGVFRPGTRFRVGYPARGTGRGRGAGLGHDAAEST